MTKMCIYLRQGCLFFNYIYIVMLLCIIIFCTFLNLIFFCIYIVDSIILIYDKIRMNSFDNLAIAIKKKKRK